MKAKIIMSDPIADLLIRIKNAYAAKREQVIIPFSKFKQSVVEVMKKGGYIKDFQVSTVSDKKVLIINLEDASIRHIRRLSKPGQRVYVAKKDIPRPLRGMGLVILSTPHGVISGAEAQKKNTGGELICEVW